MKTNSFFDLNRWPGLGRNFTALAVALTLLSSAPGLCARQASTSEEQKLIAVLESSASLRDKDSACERLKHIGTTACIPAVAKLLLDKQLSH
ncbi:MAG TPA: hypothetical protein VHH88_03915, partial [Verrucomicrobiae bacterium]|nr:hypothetical protein [Verrucomicrobiae bacterium]